MSEHHQHLARRILDWLRAGYPEGVPTTDHVALMGLLHRSLDEGEVKVIADQLAAGDPELLSREQIAEAIHDRAHEKASDADIDRVAARLAKAGFGMARTNSKSDSATAGA